jgi:hypothetical protein
MNEGWIEPDQNIYSNINIFQNERSEYINGDNKTWSYIYRLVP